ncbi:Biogenesis of lysosome-related organelles complex 1 subunit 1 [Dillenia turbinata]|uniref:Biogenesis of lysosome-related organelles complex 1 subunit 1 n=1 Tax=Dillenia turbinata TaxID=194707 RepID=A0AAN8VTR4_9MAGN
MQKPALPVPREHLLSASEIERWNSAAEAGGLEAALLHLLHLHNQSSLLLREQIEKAKKEAIKSGRRVSGLLVDAVNGGVQECFINQKRIEGEIRSLASTFMRFSKQTDQWLAASHSINTAVKEIGDFENWMKTMEFDCSSISAAIHNIHEA